MDSLTELKFMNFLSPRMNSARCRCEWIFSVQQFHTRRNGLPPLLWISRHFGFGKTTLMSFLRQRMSEEDTVDQNIRNTTMRTSMACSFFFDERNKHLANTKNLLKGLIWDILSQRHDLIHTRAQTFAKIGERNRKFNVLLWQYPWPSSSNRRIRSHPTPPIRQRLPSEWSRLEARLAGTGFSTIQFGYLYRAWYLHGRR